MNNSEHLISLTMQCKAVGLAWSQCISPTCVQYKKQKNGLTTEKTISVALSIVIHSDNHLNLCKSI